jgi:hypothetical protein
MIRRKKKKCPIKEEIGFGCLVIRQQVTGNSYPLFLTATWQLFEIMLSFGLV